MQGVQLKVRLPVIPPSGEPLVETHLLQVPESHQRELVDGSIPTYNEHLRSTTCVIPPSEDGGYFNSSLVRAPPVHHLRNPAVGRRWIFQFQPSTSTLRSTISVIPPSEDGGYFNSSLVRAPPVHHLNQSISAHRVLGGAGF
jgi:hypothetical protein